MNAASPTAIACIKASCNAEEDGGMGRMQMAGLATRMYYMTEEGKEVREWKERGCRHRHKTYIHLSNTRMSTFPRSLRLLPPQGKNAFLEKRPPEWGKVKGSKL